MKLRTNVCEYMYPGEMAVVSSSSHSSTMSSYEPPRTPPPAPPRAEETPGDSSGPSMTDVGTGFPEAASDAVDPNFLRNHFKPTPKIPDVHDIQLLLKEVRNAKSEVLMYGPACKALTKISEKFFNIIKGTELKSKLLERHKHLQGTLESPLSFIDHHSHAPSFFPDDDLDEPVRDKPDLLAVFNPSDFQQHPEGDYEGVPHHRVVSVVEAKWRTNGEGRAQAASYAYRHQQARPDHPMVFCLIIKPQWYQIILSSPNGVVASEVTSWDKLDLLLAYVYAHYDPRDDHFLNDDTMWWSETEDGHPSWSIVFEGKTYTGTFVFIGDPWGRRTTVFRVAAGGETQIVFKELYRHSGRRFKEEDILEHIHKDGDVPGFVRLKGCEYVCSGGRQLQIGVGEDVRSKIRLALHDYGDRLLQATSVNDLLKAIYDALEVHRAIYLQRRVLHRDMSIYNILMYPRWAEIKDRKVLESAPPYIQDILSGHLRPLKERKAECLLIDADNAALLSAKRASSEELTHRTGTPMFIARSVCAGEYISTIDAFRAFPMPTLRGEALRLYIQAYGKDRYHRFDEKDGITRHGAVPPLRSPYPCPDLTHRPEHDVESTFWTMVYALLLVKPVTTPQEKYASDEVAKVWNILREHAILDKPHALGDSRLPLMMMSPQHWIPYFPPEMVDVALLLGSIAEQISPEYAFWSPQPPEDHLHEAVQRLILQYLVDHRDKDIKLDPDNLRPTKAMPPKQKNSTRRTTQELGVTRGSKRKSSSGQGSQSKPKKAVVNSSTASGSKSPIVAGPSTSSRPTAERSSITSKSQRPFVVAEKQQSGSQGGRSTKRLKALSGSPVLINEEDEEDEDEE